MAKYKYRIEGGRYGGELAVGRVTPEFVNYWLPIIEDEGAYETFIPHILSLSEWDDDEDLDVDSPNIIDDEPGQIICVTEYPKMCDGFLTDKTIDIEE